MRKIALVVTTIFEPAFLAGFAMNLRRFGGAGHTTIYVIVDRKTPSSVAAACKAVDKEGVHVICPTLDEQCLFLKRLRAPGDWIPLDSDNRRNIGFLMAIEGGCDVLVSIDDDNFCSENEDFFGKHSIVGLESVQQVRESDSGWMNICEELAFESTPVPSPRGLPYALRHKTHSVNVFQKSMIVAMNAGLWLDDPDVDAISRLSCRNRALEYHGSPFCLGPTTWSPINTQNTAISREASSAYYYLRMGFPIQGMSIDRYGDILSGYFAQKCVRHLGQGVRIGDPICNHHRTQHNLFKDLYHELAGMVIIEELIPWLVELRLSGNTYQECYSCLTDELDASADRFTGFVFDRGGREFLHDTAKHMRTWLNVLGIIQR